MTQIAICTLTFKRPDWLRCTMESILEQELEAGWQCMHIIVDNDAQGSGRETAESLMQLHPGRIRYVIEPQQGIARARNRALQEAMDADLIAFIDDDEYARPGWLKALMKTQLETGADVVSGPVFPEFVSTPPQWIQDGVFFAPKKVGTGSPVRFIATNNMLMRSYLARKYRFDLRFDRTSGEDTHFFERARMDGARFVWCSEAEVVERIPAQRMTARWLLTRARSNGNRYSRSCLYLRPGLHTVLIRAVKGAACIVEGAVKLPLGVMGKQYTVHGAARVYQGLGTLSALRGQAQQYYTSKAIDS
jgi:succinoglycan biosynthesis protein ExoM